MKACYIQDFKHLKAMMLGGQVSPSTCLKTAHGMRRDNGYAMAVLLVSMSVAAIMMTVVMPVWKQMAQREKEEELVFRGQQYVRALRLFARKYANVSPPNLDVLVEQRFLRKKYKDPITNDDFQVLLAGQAVPGSPTQPGAGQPGRGGARGGFPTSPTTAGGAGAASPASTPSSPFGGGIGRGGVGNTGMGSTGRAGSGTEGSPMGRSGIGGTGIGSTGGFSPIGTPGAGSTGGIIGVASKSKDKSIRIYNGRNHYNEWAFVNTPQTLAPGVGAGGTAAPGQRGRQGQPANPSTNPFGTGIGGQRGPNPTQPSGPTSPVQPARPIQPGRGRGI